MDILLVDDERLVRMCTQSMLEELLAGTDIFYHHAGGADQARAWIADHGAPSLGFVDYKMPKCSGIEFLVQVHPICPNTGCFSADMMSQTRQNRCASAASGTFWPNRSAWRTCPAFCGRADLKRR